MRSYPQKRKMAKILHAIAALIGTIIGAGIFGIPYVVMKSGFLVGIIHIVVIGILMAITMLYLGEIALRTKKTYHLTGYADKYLGRKGKVLMLIALAFGIYAAVLAYLIGVGESFSFLLFSTKDYSLYLGIGFWVLMSLLSLFGLKALEEGEFLGVSALLILIVAISVFFFNKIDVNNLLLASSGSFIDYLAPFGVILFAFLGYTTIPEVETILGKEKKGMKKAIILAILISGIVYLIFTTIVIGFKGSGTPEIATLALGKPFILLGILTMSTSYLALSIALIDMFKFDFNQSKARGWFFTISVPIIFFILLELVNYANFTKVLGIGGVLSGGLAAVLILLMAHKAKYLGDKKPEYSMPVSKLLTGILILLFVIGTIAEIVNSI